MSNSLREQLIKAGLRPAKKKKPARKRGTGRAGKRGDGSREMSLASAYAAREREERRREAQRKRDKQREDAIRQRQNRELEALLEGRTLNDPDAEIPRHFRDGERITRIYVTGAQRDLLAENRLGIVKLRRRYFLVDPETLEAATRVKPDCVVDLSGEAEPD